MLLSAMRNKPLFHLLAMGVGQQTTSSTVAFELNQTCYGGISLRNDLKNRFPYIEPIENRVP